jgi:hypothetical protein
MIISYDSKHAVGITTAGYTKFTLKGFDIVTQAEVFSRDFEGTYVKMSCIEQTDEGTIFGVAY